jgi:hypothetical protein
VQNVARSIFCDRFLLKFVQSTTANDICSASLFVFQKKPITAQKVDRTTFCTEWKSAFILTIKHKTYKHSENCKHFHCLRPGMPEPRVQVHAVRVKTMGATGAQKISNE